MAHSTDPDAQHQIEALQTQMAFLEDTVTSLNEALSGQQREILTLRQQLTLLKQRQDELQHQQGTAPGDVADERPPHY